MCAGILLVAGFNACGQADAPGTESGRRTSVHLQSFKEIMDMDELYGLPELHGLPETELTYNATRRIGHMFDYRITTR